jgi:hypothetical protein
MEERGNEWLLTHPTHSILDTAPDGRFGEGFRMPVRDDLPACTEGRRPKAPQEGTRGGRVGGCRLWGFDGATAWLGDALAEIVGVGSTIVVPESSPRRQSTGRFWLD